MQFIKAIKAEARMAVKNTFYDSVGGIASGEGLVHIEMTKERL